MKDWIEQHIMHIRRRENKTTVAQVMPEMMPARVEAILQMIENTCEEELSCEEVADLLSEFAELKLNKKDAASLLPLVQNHLEMCSNCHEEYDALMRVLQALPG